MAKRGKIHQATAIGTPSPTRSPSAIIGAIPIGWTNALDDSAPRSNFVTVLAWIFIVLSAFCTVMAILQNVMVALVFNRSEVRQAMQVSQAHGAPPFAEFMFGHMQWFFLGFLLFSALLLVTSIGLLKRWNWARLVFIAFMVLSIVWSIGGIGLQAVMLSSMQDDVSAMPQAPVDFRVFQIVTVSMSALFALAFSVLYAWIIRRLASAPVIAEFKANASDGGAQVSKHA